MQRPMPGWIRPTDEKWWAKAAILNVANSGKFTSDRTIEEYVRDIWHLKKVTVEM